jgi:hypothetical protein
MSNVIEFPQQQCTVTIAKSSGIVDVFLEKDGMVTIDAHVSAALFSALLPLLETAGIAINRNS